MDIFFLYNDSQIVPRNLLRATHGFEDFRAVHMEYWQKYGGQYGLCTYQDAYEYLASDLEEHGLPVRYSSYESFRVLRFRKHHK